MRHHLSLLSMTCLLAGGVIGGSVVGWTIASGVANAGNVSCPDCELRAALLSYAGNPLGTINSTNAFQMANLAGLLARRNSASLSLAANQTPAAVQPLIRYPTAADTQTVDPTGGALKLDTTFPVPPSPFSGYFGDHWYVSNTYPPIIVYDPGQGLMNPFYSLNPWLQNGGTAAQSTAAGPTIQFQPLMPLSQAQTQTFSI